MTPFNTISVFISFIVLYFNMNITNPQDYRFFYKREADRSLWPEKKKVALDILALSSY
jgi:hypothetical protein